MSSASASELETGEIMPDWVRPIVKESLSERAYRELRLALMRGQLRPDTRLRLRPMSARFGISATPMREALLRLVAEKALALDARGSVVVPRLTLDQLLEIRAIRTDLEGRAAAAGAARDSAEVDALEAIHAQISQCHASRDFARAVNLNTEFHLTLCKIGQMPILYEIVELLWVRCGPILSHLYDDGVPDWEPHPHRRIIDALRDRDPVAARDAVREDIERGGSGLFAHVRAAAKG
ncbi:GntR family transcriptional regulator [Methylobacterium radiotolerans]|jgi:DNA-binding GntR family transcriptional regulator|uniref:Transcriptional regulator, GntR family n=2 Tax=Methylobacteriaceae TaxID=119045 RepID=B1LT56_METRJ|nr:transcriptional regulator, GntR family [Methylobacterium radiotolerans JCM 2831]KZB97384.1 HTH-type transcriptional regulator McbR [Methylobacterium radiotolerans]OXE42629.1 GntR family transcriptional regulator [Methylobacterium radiotolerans]PJI54932.1 GntR family transcriptional regulator [Methylobacterium radiotolerans]GAN46138.1 GntR family transcriptional regulator [Methylobacterium sp. ME121]